MAQVPSLMQRAKAPRSFKKPDIGQFVSPDMKDAVARVVAAGHRMIYSPDMRQELRAEVQRDAPVPQKMAEAIVGLLLTLDKQSQGGLPMGAIFPAAIELLGEAAEILTAAGQTVTQDDFNQAAQLSFVLIGKKLGASDQQLMQAAQGAVGSGQQPMDGKMENEPGEGPEHEQAEGPDYEAREEAEEGDDDEERMQ